MERFHTFMKDWLMVEQQENTFGQKVVRYTRSLSRWIKAGRPVRGEEEEWQRPIG